MNSAQESATVRTRLLSSTPAPASRCGRAQSSPANVFPDVIFFACECW